MKAKTKRTGKSSASLAAAIAAATLAVTGQAAAQPAAEVPDHALEVYLSDNALQAQYLRSLEFNDEIGPAEVRGGFFYNEDRDLILTGDFLARLGDVAERRVIEVRVGTRVYGGFLAIEDQDVFGVGLGGEAEYFIGRSRQTSLKLAFYYAPDIVTFGQADDIKDATFRLQTALRSGTDIFVGFRVFEIDFPIDREVDDNVHIGFRRSF